MWCPKCGAANEDSARFCSACGRDLSASGQQAAAPGAQGAGAPGSSYQQNYSQQYQPAYQSPQYRTTQGYNAVPHVPSYMGWAIVVLICCFWPTGIAAVVNASRVGNFLAMGNITAAQEASRKAKMWCWMTFGIGVAWIALVIILYTTVLGTTYHY
jgi:Interferon-induced transmembrane protein/zinc-ribbon domain